jgi:phospholipid N-methyltransferase
MSTLLYLKSLITDIHIGSVTPTSKFCVERVCEKISFAESKLIVEYGPGTGIFTSYLLRNMSADSKLIAVERNKVLCQALKKKIKDPRLLVFHDSAENILEILKSCNGSIELKADCIVSGIPFSLIPRETRMSLLQNSYSILRKGGKFLAYQAFFQLPEFLKNPLEELFLTVHTQYVIPCLPPMICLEAVK